jgi:hypothetical protein
MWRQYVDVDNTADRRLFNEIIRVYGLFHGVCQNTGIAIDDYSRLHGNVESSISIRETDFRPPYAQHPELQVSERINQIYSEARSRLFLVNPAESMLVFLR